MATLGGLQPLFSFGVISDVQYADIPDGHSFSGVPRYYRHSMQVLQGAISKWNDHKKLQFSMNFGDIVDGFCPKDKSLITVQKVVKEFDRFNGPTYHMIGNHCLYNLPRSKLISLLKLPSIHGHAYYDFSPCPGYRFIVLDAYEISTIGWPQGHPNTLAAMQILEAKNPNSDKNSPNGMVGLEKRFLKFNGAVGKEQLLWLDDALKDSTKNEQKVVICCHLPLHPKAASAKALLWDYEDVLNLIHSYKCVKACFAGHDHKGGYTVDSHGIHHRVFEAALECPPESNAYGYIDVYRDRLSLIVIYTYRNCYMIYVPTNPRGAERLPPCIVVPESDFYLRRLWGNPDEDLIVQQKYLVTFTVGYEQKNNIDAAVKKFSENFTILLFHYDGRTTEWDEFEWSKRAIHVSARKQTKWWYAKRFLHPDIVARYEYIFIWDEDLGLEHFDAEEYIKLVKKHGLEISQPGLEPNNGLTWQMTKRRGDHEVHKFVEIMATVFSRDAWRCVWHMIQNDLVHGWGLDFALRKCVEPAHEKIGVVDAQWIVHQVVPSLGNQGQAEKGKAPWEGVRERCRKEWAIFQSRLSDAERAYYLSMGIAPRNSTVT
ncbi:lysine ketoglutarate reductase trans-splicing related 1 [Musa troglodytarum]|nr:lysine ketoglutarate reductase trans-splicing related 1 [Musa troglodytarum]URD83658.1 lysine ketoglutarate reductase trans-splicing related 1 [Musa troglodytarum]